MTRSSKRRGPRGRIAIARAVVLLLAGLFVLTLLVRSVGVDRFLGELASADLRFVGLTFALYLGELGVRVLRWLLLFGHAKTGQSLTIWLVGTAANEVGPSGTGEVVRGVFGHERYGLPLARVLTPTAVERLFDLVFLLGLAAFALGILLVPVPLLAFAVPAAIVLAGLGLLLRPQLLAVVGTRLRPRPGMVGRLGAFLLGFAHDFATLARRRGILVAAFVLSGIVWSLEGLAQWAMLRSLGVQIDVAAVVALTAVGFLAGFVSFLPGGLGSREAALSGLLVLRGVAASPATTAAVALRVGQTLTVLALGATAALAAFRPSSNEARSPGVTSADPRASTSTASPPRPWTPATEPAPPSAPPLVGRTVPAAEPEPDGGMPEGSGRTGPQWKV